MAAFARGKTRCSFESMFLVLESWCFSADAYLIIASASSPPIVISPECYWVWFYLLLRMCFFSAKMKLLLFSISAWLLSVRLSLCFDLLVSMDFGGLSRLTIFASKVFRLSLVMYSFAMEELTSNRSSFSECHQGTFLWICLSACFSGSLCDWRTILFEVTLRRHEVVTWRKDSLGLESTGKVLERYESNC